MSNLADILLANLKASKNGSSNDLPDPEPNEIPKTPSSDITAPTTPPMPSPYDGGLSAANIQPNRIERANDAEIKSNASSTDDYVRELLDPNDRQKNVWYVVEGPKGNELDPYPEESEFQRQGPRTPRDFLEATEHEPPNRLPNIKVEASSPTGNVSNPDQDMNDQNNEHKDSSKDVDRESKQINRGEDGCREKRKDRVKDREEDRERDRDRARERGRDRDRERDQDRDRDRGRDRYRDKARDKDSDRYRHRDRDRSHEKSRSHHRLRDADRYRDGDRNRDVDRHRDGDRHKDRYRDHDRDRDRNRNRDGDRVSDHDHHRDRDRDRSREDRRRERNRDYDKLERQDKSQKYRIYVGGLHLGITEEMLKSIFAPFGPILRIELMRDRTTNIPRGYAFITYANIEDGQEAVKNLDGFELAAKTLRVSKSNDKPWSGPSNTNMVALDRHV